MKVSSKNQIAVPAEVRRELKIKPGDTLLVSVEGGHVVLMPEPVDYVAALRGLGAEIWEGIDAQEYVNRERSAWDE